MRRRLAELHNISRRQFFQHFRWAPLLLLPAPLRAGGRSALLPRDQVIAAKATSNPALRLTPEYPVASPLERMLRLVAPGTDRYIAEEYAAELHSRLQVLRQMLTTHRTDQRDLHDFFDQSAVNIQTTVAETHLRDAFGIKLRSATYQLGTQRSAEPLVADIANYFHAMGAIETAEFEITAVRETVASPLELETEVRYSLVGARADHIREERVGRCRLSWVQRAAGSWLIRSWTFLHERVAAARQRLFEDTTAPALGATASYRGQLSHGVDYWRTVLDGACGIDVYGNNGVAAGDFDGDGRDDIYVCQPSGLPNRLYRNRGDGIFEDVTEKAGVGVFDATACAIFADFKNQGLQDILLVRSSGPLLYSNQGNGKFLL